MSGVPELYTCTEALAMAFQTQKSRNIWRHAQSNQASATAPRGMGVEEIKATDTTGPHTDPPNPNPEEVDPSLHGRETSAADAGRTQY